MPDFARLPLTTSHFGVCEGSAYTAFFAWWVGVGWCGLVCIILSHVAFFPHLCNIYTHLGKCEIELQIYMKFPTSPADSHHSSPFPTCKFHFRTESHPHFPTLWWYVWPHRGWGEFPYMCGDVCACGRDPRKRGVLYLQKQKKLKY